MKTQMDDEIKQAIIDLIKTPKTYTVDGESVTQQSASDILSLIKKIEADEKSDKPLKRCGFFRVSTQEAGR